MVKDLLVLMLFFYCSSSYSANYYIAPDGHDSNTGRSIESPWKSIEKLTGLKLKPGDSLLFKAQGVYAGELYIQQSGKSGKPIVIGSYGIGAAPIIKGTIQPQNITTNSKKQIVSECALPVYELFYDNQVQTCARYPNSGWLRVDEGFDNNHSFADYNLTQANNYWDGANVRYRIWDWEYRSAPVKTYQNNIISLADSATNTFSAQWGYFFDNKYEELDTIGEWFYAQQDGQLFYIPHANFDPYKLELCVFNTAITIGKGLEHICISGIQFEKFHKAALLCEGNNKHIVFENNRIQYITQTAVKMQLLSQYCTIRNNTITNIRGRGIFAIEPDFLLVENNTLTNIGMHQGYGIHGINGMVGIAITNVEEPKTAQMHIASNNIIRHNRLDSIGYVGIRMDGSNSLMEKNYISNAMFNLSDGAAIYCWSISPHYTYNNTIRQNIVQNVFGNCVGTPHEHGQIANGIYIDNRCYNIRLQNNTIINCSGTGIHINAEAFNNIADSNLVYNANIGVCIAEFMQPYTTYGNIISNNTFFCTQQQQRCVNIVNWIVPDVKKLGLFKNNTYCNFHEKYLLKDGLLSADKEMKIQSEYTFEAWQKLGVDSGSKALGINHKELSKFKQSEVFFNTSEEIQNIEISQRKFIDLQGNGVKQISLMPWQSIILLYK